MSALTVVAFILVAASLLIGVLVLLVVIGGSLKRDIEDLDPNRCSTCGGDCGQC